MSTSITKKPRRRLSPSRRDQELYVLYQTTGLTQDELAEKYEVNQSRVSQIVRRVEKWRAEINPQPHDLTPAGGKTPVEQRRLDRWLERERSEAIIKQALRQAERPQVTKTTKTGPDGEEVTIRELPLSPQWLRLAQRANEQLFRREALEPLPVERPDDELRQQIMQQELIELCIHAPGGVFSQKSRPYTLVRQLLQLLRGESRGEDEKVDPGFGELAQLLAKQAAGDARRGSGDPAASDDRRSPDPMFGAGLATPPPRGLETFGPGEWNAQETVPQLDDSRPLATRTEVHAENASDEPAANTISSTCADSGDWPQTESEEELECQNPVADSNSPPPKRLSPKLRKYFEQAVNDPETPEEAREPIRRQLLEHSQLERRRKEARQVSGNTNRPTIQQMG